MRAKLLIPLSVAATAVLSVLPAHSQPLPGAAVANEAELIGLRQLCDGGDRQACIRFGFMLGEARERHVEWRRSHPEWWAWEHR